MGLTDPRLQSSAFWRNPVRGAHSARPISATSSQVKEELIGAADKALEIRSERVGASAWEEKKEVRVGRSEQNPNAISC